MRVSIYISVRLGVTIIQNKTIYALILHIRILSNMKKMMPIHFRYWCELVRASHNCSFPINSLESHAANNIDFVVFQDAHALKKIWNKVQNRRQICITFCTTLRHELYSCCVGSRRSCLVVLLLAVEAKKSCCLRPSFDFIENETEWV